VHVFSLTFALLLTLFFIVFHFFIFCSSPNVTFYLSSINRMLYLWCGWDRCSFHLGDSEPRGIDASSLRKPTRCFKFGTFWKIQKYRKTAAL
jgi:hypothetical protein